MDVGYDFAGQEDKASASDAEEQGEGEADGNERALDLSKLEEEFGDEREGEIRENEKIETE
jgi:hypothetical protein